MASHSRENLPQRDTMTSSFLFTPKAGAAMTSRFDGVSFFKLLSSRLIAAQHDAKTAESREIRCEYIPQRSPAKMELTNQSISAQI